MSERGVFALDRGWFDHAAFAKEPFTEREAWAWLISEAAFKCRVRRVGKVEVSLQRGQLAASIRFLAERFSWSKSRAHRFLDRLKNRDMLRTDGGTGVLVITICNYDVYQRVSLPGGTPTGTENGTVAGQQRDKREDTKDIEENKLTGGGVRATVVQLRPQAKRMACRLPDDFTLTEELLAMARQEGLTDAQAHREFAKFCDHFRQSNLSSAVKRDWNAAARNWFRKAVDGLGQSRGNGSNGHGRADDSRVGAYARATARSAETDYVSGSGPDIFDSLVS